MARPARKPLYDLMKSRRRLPHRDARPVEPEEDDAPVETGSGWLSPGRVLRMPVGYVLLAMAGITIGVIAAYVVGYQRGGSAARSRFEQTYLGSGNVDGMAERLRDPLDDTAGDAGGSLSTAGSAAAPAVDVTGGADERRSSWGPIESDPRESGVAYFVLAETRPDGARRLARFCRDHGLETYVVGRQNARLRRVVALPGFRPGDRASDAVKGLEARIHAIGARWRHQEPGATDLRDAYPREYRP